APSPSALDELSAALGAARRAVLVAGPAGRAAAGAREAIAALARASGLPLLAEATSQLRLAGGERPPGLVAGFDLALRTPGARRELAPDLIVQLGAPPVSSAWARLREETRARAAVIAPH